MSQVTENEAMIQKDKMIASRQRRYGPPDVLAVEQVCRPQPGAKEVLIRVHASTVNRTDDGFLRAKPFIIRLFAGLLKPKFKITGSEFAGEIVKLGDDVEGFKIGDAVCGFKDDDFGFGCHAQYTTMAADGMMALIPDILTYESAAPAMEGAHYALFYIRASKIQKGQTAFVNGGTGAIGSAAIQILKSMGVRVTATAPTAYIETVRELGAEPVIDYQKDDFTRITETFDLIFDAVGQSTYGHCKHLLNEGGVYASSELGPFAQNPFLAFWTQRFGRHKVIFPIPKNTKEDAEFITGLMASGAFKPLIDRTYDLSEIVSAFNYVHEGQKIGNVVIRIS